MKTHNLDEQIIQKKVALADSLGLEVFRCPTTNNLIEGVRGDDKVICNCAAAGENGTHYKHKLVRVTTRDYVVETMKAKAGI